MATGGLGRGLSSLIPPKQSNTKQGNTPIRARKQTAGSSAVEGDRVLEIPLNDITPNPQQPRTDFDETALNELAASIKEYGLLEPIVVTPNEDGGWFIIAGERRFRAHKQLGKKTIKAIERTASELERLQLALIENIQRQDLHPIEKAQSYAMLIDQFGLKQAEAAKRLGIARSSLANAVRLLELPVEIQDGLASGKIAEGHAKVLLGCDSEEEQLRLYAQMTNGAQMSVRDLEASVNQGANKDKKKGRSVVDHAADDLARQLESHLGTKVQVQRKSKGAFRILIDTYSSDDLKDIVRKITG